MNLSSNLCSNLCLNLCSNLSSNLFCILCVQNCHEVLPRVLGIFRVCLVGWMKWDRMGSSYFLVFDWESAVSVRSEHQEKWDKFIPKKITDELIPLY
jgi:hypothetical protein